jgi:ribosomal protein L24E
MPKCSYCGQNYEFPRGLTLVDLVGRIRYYCSSKCRKYAAMNRKKGKWAIVKKETKVEVKK